MNYMQFVFLSGVVLLTVVQRNTVDRTPSADLNVKKCRLPNHNAL